VGRGGRAAGCDRSGLTGPELVAFAEGKLSGFQFNAKIVFLIEINRQPVIDA
jgi:hypothetical protein